MPNRMYVGNIPFSFTSEDLGKLFSEFGEVVYSQVVQDRETGRSRGFGFVEMATRDMFQAALEQGDGREVDGRAISVTEAREREARPAGGRPRPAGDRPYQGGGGGGGGGRPYSGGGGGAGGGGGGGGGGRDWGERSGGGGRGGERGGRDSDRGGRDHGRGGRDHERGGRGGERPKGPRRRDDDSDVADRDWGVGHIEREGDRDSRRSRFEGLPDDVD